MRFLICLREEEPMNSSGKAGNGRGNNRKRSRRRNFDSEWKKADSGQESDNSNKNGFPKKQADMTRKEGIPKEKPFSVDRPKWTPLKTNPDPMPVSICPWCEKPIRDISSAIADKETGVPVHFDCVTARIALGEKLEKGETVAYIGGGRFGIVCSGSYQSKAPEQISASGRGSTPLNRDLTIKKIIEWESKDRKTDWRSAITELYSISQ
jgi:hypothetical protein